jgi:predicted nucleic acid-binding protein
MRIVVDTNVFVSACLGEGASNAMIAAGLQRRYVPLMGAALLVEYEDVMGRADLFRISRLAQRERDELLDIFLANCEWTRVYLWRQFPDEVDNHLANWRSLAGRNVW